MVLMSQRRRRFTWATAALFLLLMCQQKQATCGNAMMATTTTEGRRHALPRLRQQQQQQQCPLFARPPAPFIGASSPLVVSSSSATCDGCDDDNVHDDDDDAISIKYLDRIGIYGSQAEAFHVRDPDNRTRRRRRRPNLSDLQHLLTAHLRKVPFENLDQHSHPANNDYDDNDIVGSPKITTRTKFIPRKQPPDLPSLDVNRSLHKICDGNRGRGGFCYELNLSFAWLLRSLGFHVRLAVADVACKQDIPAHVIILVDGLLTQVQGDEKDGDHACSAPKAAAAAARTGVLVDVGFGTPGVCNVVLPLVLDESTFDTHGDSFRFARCCTNETDGRRFDTILYRTRVSTNVEEPMYRFCATDDMPYNAEEFAAGLNHVLNNSPTFTQKRLCVRSTETGHVTLGEGYVKWVERGEVVRFVELGSETQWRQVLLQHFGVSL